MAAAVAPASMMAAAATAAAVPVASASVAASAAVPVASTAVAAMADELYHRWCSVALLVEDVERRQADVRDFFLMESNSIAISVRWTG
jgi:hypothetical protein